MPRWPRLEVKVGPLASIAATLAFGLSVAPLSTRQTEAPSRSTASVETVGMTVADMDRALAFYTTALPFSKVSDETLESAALDQLSGVRGPRRVVRLRLGDETIELTDYLRPGGRPIPADSRSQDRWFQHVAIIVSDMDRAYARLKAHAIDHVSPAPQRLPDWNPNAGGIQAFYFRDPDRHVLEILSFPAGKGDPKWRQATGGLFLGIDHTAIVVADTGRSLAFYRDLLDLRVAGASENYGIEQARLNDVAGAHLRITALRGHAGPGVEFLEYLSPRDARPAAADTRPDDLVHWETTIVSGALARLARRLEIAQVLFVSPAVVTLTRGPAALVRDPDGHAVRLLERTS